MTLKLQWWKVWKTNMNCLVTWGSSNNFWCGTKIQEQRIWLWQISEVWQSVNGQCLSHISQKGVNWVGNVSLLRIWTLSLDLTKLPSMPAAEAQPKEFDRDSVYSQLSHPSLLVLVLLRSMLYCRRPRRDRKGLCDVWTHLLSWLYSIYLPPKAILAKYYSPCYVQSLLRHLILAYGCVRRRTVVWITWRVIPVYSDRNLDSCIQLGQYNTAVALHATRPKQVGDIKHFCLS